MSRMAPGVQWKSGAIDFDSMQPSARNLNLLVNGDRYVPIRRSFWPRRFPMFRASRFSLVEDYGFVINVWRIRDEVENFRVIGGVETDVDKSMGYIAAYQGLLTEILGSEDQSHHVFSILDHVISSSLMNSG